MRAGIRGEVRRWMRRRGFGWRMSEAVMGRAVGRLVSGHVDMWEGG